MSTLYHFIFDFGVVTIITIICYMYWIFIVKDFIRDKVKEEKEDKTLNNSVDKIKIGDAVKYKVYTSVYGELHSGGNGFYLGRSSSGIYYNVLYKNGVILMADEVSKITKDYTAKMDIEIKPTEMEILKAKLHELESKYNKKEGKGNESNKI